MPCCLASKPPLSSTTTIRSSTQPPRRVTEYMHIGAHTHTHAPHAKAPSRQAGRQTHSAHGGRMQALDPPGCTSPSESIKKERQISRMPHIDACAKPLCRCLETHVPVLSQPCRARRFEVQRPIAAAVTMPSTRACGHPSVAICQAPGTCTHLRVFAMLQVTWGARLTACRPSRQGSTLVSQFPQPSADPLESSLPYTEPFTRVSACCDVQVAETSGATIFPREGLCIRAPRGIAPQSCLLAQD